MRAVIDSHGYRKAKAITEEYGRVSVTLLVRKQHLVPDDAQHMINRMLSDGFVFPPMGNNTQYYYLVKTNYDREVPPIVLRRVRSKLSQGLSFYQMTEQNGTIRRWIVSARNELEFRQRRNLIRCACAEFLNEV